MHSIRTILFQTETFHINTGVLCMYMCVCVCWGGGGGGALA